MGRQRAAEQDARMSVVDEVVISCHAMGRRTRPTGDGLRIFPGLGRSGRQLNGTTALYTGEGELFGVSEAVWIEPKP